ncbi:MAG: HAMP domain-containing histidine kinase [Geodermatophilaceae bacterium]|nr:HAMP domain-containing histidine kinase [Geodermatophilaceae bacterium]
MNESRLRPFSRWGVRRSSAAAAALVSAVALAVGALAVVLLLQRGLTQSVQQAATQRAATVAAQLADSGSAGIRQSMAGAPGELSVAQVLLADGTVVTSSPELEGEAAIADLRPRPGTTASVQQRLPVGEDTYVVVSTGVAGPDEDYVVLVGQSLEPAHESIARLVLLLAIGVPLLVVVVGGATFVVAGRSLRPVEAIREQVARISAQDLSERVPVTPADDEVGRLARTMNDMLGRLEAAQRTQRQFVADASHELRSPITALNAGLQGLTVHPDATALPTVCQELMAETARLDRLVGSLLMLARADERGLPLHVEDVDLDDLAQRQRARLRRATGLAVRGRVDPVRVRGNRHQLDQVIRNLVDNAERHASSQVRISVFADGSDAVVEVSDDGPGIPVADRERVFHRFVRLDEHRSASLGGSGLGLAIVAEVVASHGGTVAVTESEVAGARLRVRLPRDPHEEAQASTTAKR